MNIRDQKAESEYSTRDPGTTAKKELMSHEEENGPIEKNQDGSDYKKIVEHD